MSNILNVIRHQSHLGVGLLTDSVVDVNWS